VVVDELGERGELGADGGEVEGGRFSYRHDEK
jgi:hypothetical protein